MAYSSNIQWTDATHNFWTGCQKVSAGCKFCYMHRIIDGKSQDPNIVTRASFITFSNPINWKDRRMIFTCSMSDFFIAEADKWRAEAWDVIRKTPQHRWQILTKRPERILENLPPDWGTGWKNVALGVTVENQDSVERMHILANIPAYVRFISAEPLLEDVNLLELDSNGNMSIQTFNWVIIGGESGNETGKYRYRPTEIPWIERIVTDLRGNTKAAIFIKQLGTYQKHQLGLKDSHGGNILEFPKHLRIREMPRVKRETV